MDNKTYYQRNRDKILHKAKNYYNNNDERLREYARNKYRNLSEEDKNKIRDNIKTYLKKIKIKKENMQKLDTIICLKKKSKK